MFITECFLLTISIAVCAAIGIRRNKSKSDWFLFLFITANGLSALGAIIWGENEVDLLDILIVIQYPVWYYCHLSAFIKPKQKLFIWLYQLPTYILTVFVIYALVTQNFEVFNNTLFRIFLFTIIFLLIIYGIVGLMTVSKGNLEHLNEKERRWISRFGWLYNIYFIPSIVLTLAIDDGNLEQQVDFFNLLFGAVVLVYIVYEAFVNEVILPRNRGNGTEESSDSNERQLFEKIDRLVNSEQLYLNEAFNLQLLSERLNTNQKYVSQAINKQGQKNFTTYINELRISAFEEKLNDTRYKNYTISAIAEECGFKSVSSFNRVFKVHRNSTPSAYRESLNN